MIYTGYEDNELDYGYIKVKTKTLLKNPFSIRNEI